MAKVPLKKVTNIMTSVGTLNEDFERIEKGFENTLSRDGTGPNQMEAILDMNLYPIINLPKANQPGMPVTYDQLDPGTQEVVVVPVDTDDILNGAITPDKLSTDPLDRLLFTSELLYSPSATTIAYRTVLDKLRDSVDIADFYGGRGVYDPSVDGTPYLKAAFDSDAPSIVISGPLYVKGVTELNKTKSIMCTGSGKLIITDESQIPFGSGVIRVNSNNNVIDLVFDGNELGGSGISCWGSGNYIRAVGRNFRGSASSAGYESLILVQGGIENVLWAEGYDLDQGDSPNENCPRIISTQGTSSDTTIEYIGGNNVACGHTSLSSKVLVKAANLKNVQDNGFYWITGANNHTLLGGVIENCPEPIVAVGSDHTIYNTVIINSGAIGIQNTTRLYLFNCHKRGDSTLPSSFIAARGSNVTSNTIVMEGCTGAFSPANGGIAQLFAGTVNDFQVLNCRFKLTWTDSTPAGTTVVTHATGNGVIYRNTTVEIIDGKSTPMTGSDVLAWQLPVVTNDSYWDSMVINRSAAIVRVNRATQEKLYIDGTGGQLRADLNALQFFTVGSVQQQRRFESTAMPTGGTWRVGDYVKNISPAITGTAGSQYVIKGWIRLTTGTGNVLNTDWAQDRAATGT